MEEGTCQTAEDKFGGGRVELIIPTCHETGRGAGFKLGKGKGGPPFSPLPPNSLHIPLLTNRSTAAFNRARVRTSGKSSLPGWAELDRPAGARRRKGGWETRGVARGVLLREEEEEEEERGLAEG